VGYHNFVRNNPKSDRFEIERFHHLEYYCLDATNCSRRFSWGLGMDLVAKTDLSTGNSLYASYAIKSNELTFLFTAPYNSSTVSDSIVPTSTFDTDSANKFIIRKFISVNFLYSIMNISMSYSLLPFFNYHYQNMVLLSKQLEFE